MLQTPRPVQNAARSALSGALIGVGILFIFVVFQAAQPSELADARAMDQAQVARNLSRGEGFTTRFIRPLTLARMPQFEGHPDLVNAPLHPYIMSGLFRLLGPSTRVASWTSGLAFLLTIPLVYWLATRIFSRKVAVLASLGVATDLGLLVAASGGTQVALAGLLFTALMIALVLLQGAKEQHGLWIGAAAVTCGLLYLTDYVYFLILIPVLAFVVLIRPAPQRPGVFLGFLLVFVLVCAPWWVRNLTVVRSPIYSASWHETIMGTRTHSGNTLYREMTTTPEPLAAYIIHHPRELYEKVRDAALTFMPATFTLAGVVMTPFFLVASLIPLGYPPLDRLRLVLYAAIILVAWGALFIVPETARLLPMAPMVILIAAAFFYQLLDLRLRPLNEHSRERWTTVAVTILLGCHALPMVLHLVSGRATETRQPMRVRRACEELNRLTEEYSSGLRTPRHDPIFTDMPWAIAWHADRPAIWIPATMVDVRRIEQQGGPVRWLVLTPQIVNARESEKAEYWADLWYRGLRESLVSEGWRVHRRLAGDTWVLLERIPELASLTTLDPGQNPPR